jgi:hypothetical protein
LQSKTYRSTAWLNGQMQWHMRTERTPEGKFKATADSVPGISALADEEHQAVNRLKEQLVVAAAKGEI